MLKLIAKTIRNAADSIDAIDTQQLKDKAVAAGSKTVVLSAKGVLGAANAVAGFAERYADPAARRARQLEEARALIAKLEAQQ